MIGQQQPCTPAHLHACLLLSITAAAAAALSLSCCVYCCVISHRCHDGSKSDSRTLLSAGQLKSIGHHAEGREEEGMCHAQSPELRSDRKGSQSRKFPAVDHGPPILKPLS
jgi:hypothetical protein